MKSLRGTLKDKNGNIVMTEGGLKLGGAIMSIGAYNVAHAHKKASVHAKKTFVHVDQLLKLGKMGFMVHRAAVHAGLKVTHHETRGRSLVQGETSAAGEARGQQSTVENIIDNAPNRPWRPDLAELVMRFGFDLEPMAWHQIEVVDAMRDRLNDAATRDAYANDIAAYLNRQNFLFTNTDNGGGRGLPYWIRRYLAATVSVRESINGDFRPAFGEYDKIRYNFLRYLDGVNNLRVTPVQFVNLLDRIAGFQRAPRDLRDVANEELRLALRNREAVNTLLQRGFLPPEVIAHILHFMMIMTGSGL